MNETNPADTVITREEAERIKDTPMLFILGKGRSGTSLLQNLLDAHPGIIGGPESKFIVIFYPYFAHIKKWKESDVLEFVEKIYMEPLFATLWHLDKKELTESLLSVKDIATYPLLCKLVYYQLRNGKENLLYISDKNPEYILYLNTIEKIFPGAKYIHIVREPRDNIYSHMTSFKTNNTLFRSVQWVRYNAIVEKRKKRGPGKYLTILYENLVSDTEGTMKSVCDFLGISFSSQITQNNAPDWLNAHYERKGVKKEEDGTLIHRNLLQPINTSNIGKWKNKLSINDQTVIELIAGDFAQKTYGYEIDGNPKNKAVKVSPLYLFKGKFLFFLWQEFSRLKAKSFRFNLFYSNLKRRNKRVPIWDYF